MEGKKICSNCGTENNNETVICKSCGRVLSKDTKQEVEEVDEKTNIDSNIEIQENDSKVGNIIGIISLVLFFGFGLIFPIVINTLNIPSLVNNTIIVLIPIISVIAGIILITYGMIKYPKNKFMKIVLAIITAAILFGIILFIIVIRLCAKSISDTCSNVDSEKVQETCEALE